MRRWNWVVGGMAAMVVVMAGVRVAAGGTLTFSEPSGSPLPVGSEPIAAVGDVNGDGYADIVTANTQASIEDCPVENPTNTTFTILLGDGAGHFTESPNSPVPSGVIGTLWHCLTLADVNGDGALDIVAGNNVSHWRPAPSNAVGVIVLLNDGAGRFSPATGSPFATGGKGIPSDANNPDRLEARRTFVADMNNDGRADLVALTDPVGGELSVLLGDGSGGFALSAGSPFLVYRQSVTNPVGKQAAGAVMGDFNGDGVPDVAVTMASSIIAPSLYIMLGDGVGGFVPAPYSPVDTENGGAVQIIADLNRDGCDDIPLMSSDNLGHGWFKVVMSDGTGGFRLTTGPRLNNMLRNMTVGDFNGDGMADIAGYGMAVGLVEGLYVHLGDGAGGLGDGSGFTSGAAVGCTTKVTTGDLNGDGKPDIVESHMHQWSSADHANKVTVLLNTTSGDSAPLIAPPFLAGGRVGQPFRYTIKASGTAPITFTANPLPAGLSRSGNVISGTPTQVGQTLVTLTAANAAGSDTNVLTVMITDPSNHPPQIAAGPTAVPNRAGVGNPVACSVTATDADGDSLSYYWVFGDGTTSTAQNPSHSFSTNGEFMVSVRVTDGKGGSATAGVKVTVSDEKPGDLNGDGVVNVDDVTLVTSHYGQTSANPNWDARADADGNGVVDDADLALVKANFGRKYQ